MSKEKEQSPSQNRRITDEIWDYYGYSPLLGRQEQDKLAAAVRTANDSNTASLTQLLNSDPVRNRLSILRRSEIARLENRFQLLRDLQGDMIVATSSDATRTANNFILRVGSDLLLYKAYRENRRLSGELMYPDESFRLLDLAQFLDVDPVTIRFGNLSLSEVLEQKPIPPADFVGFLMIPYILLRTGIEGFNPKDEMRKVRAANEIYPRKEYPNRSLDNILYAAQIVAALGDLDTDLQMPVGGSFSPLQKEAYQEVVKLSKFFDNVKERLYQTLLNPASPDYDRVMGEFTRYFRSSESFLRLLKITRLLDLKRVRATYQQIKILKSGRKNPGLYDLMLFALDKRLSELTRADALSPISELDIVTAGDLDSYEESTPQWTPLRQQAVIIDRNNRVKGVKASPTQQIDMSTVDTSWDPFIRPQSVEFAPDQYNPCTAFRLSVYWVDEGTGEDLPLHLIFKIRKEKETVEWSFIEDSSDREYRGARNALIELAVRLLTIHAQNTARAIPAQREKVKTNPHEPEATRPPKKRIQDPVYLERTKVREAARTRNSSSSHFSLTESDETPVSPTPTLKVKQLDREAFCELIDPVTSTDRQMIIDALERYAQPGNNCIIRLRVQSKEGFTHRARIGRYRIFLTEEKGFLIPKAVRRRRDVDYGKI